MESSIAIRSQSEVSIGDCDCTKHDHASALQAACCEQRMSALVDTYRTNAAHEACLQELQQQHMQRVEQLTARHAADIQHWVSQHPLLAVSSQQDICNTSQ